MAQRTTEAKVQKVLLANWDGKASLQPFIDIATIIVDRVETCADAADQALTAAELERIECLLAAHFYAISDKPYASRSNLSSSGSFDGKTNMYLEATLFGQQAVIVDHSGCLAGIGSGTKVRAGATWLGRRPSQQTDYMRRD